MFLTLEAYVDRVAAEPLRFEPGEVARFHFMSECYIKVVVIITTTYILYTYNCIIMSMICMLYVHDRYYYIF